MFLSCVKVLNEPLKISEPQKKTEGVFSPSVFRNDEHEAISQRELWVRNL